MAIYSTSNLTHTQQWCGAATQNASKYGANFRSFLAALETQVGVAVVAPGGGLPFTLPIMVVWCEVWCEVWRGGDADVVVVHPTWPGSGSDCVYEDVLVITNPTRLLT